MTSKEELEKLLNDINEQGQVITTNPNLIVNFNVNLEMFTAIIGNALKDLERLEVLEKENERVNKLNKYLGDLATKINQDSSKTITNLIEENERLKKHNGRLTRKIQNLYKEHATLICDLSLLRSNNKALLKLVGEIEVLNND